MANIQSREVQYSGGGAEMQGAIFFDADQLGTRPGVLVVHEWWGCNDYSRRRAAMLAELGYTAMAVDMYGNGQQAGTPDEAGGLMTALLSDLSVVRERFEAAADVLRADESVDAGRLAAIGYCMGGGIVLHMARHGSQLAAVASFHGSLGLGIAAEGEGSPVSGKVIAYHGAEDGFIPDEDISGLAADMEAAGADYQLVSIPGAVHAFTNPAATEKGETYGIPLRYDELADRCSWDHMQLLLRSAF